MSKASIRVESADVHSGHIVNGVESAPHQDLPVCLHCDGSDRAIRIRGKSIIDTAVRIEPVEVVEVVVPYQDLPVWLNCDGGLQAS